MQINFVNEDLTKEIVSDKPCFDGNDVTNLISLDPVKRGKGFLVERFVKPPVLINIEFICSVTINQITVNCQVGIQKSSSIEVFTKQNGSTKKVIVARKQLRENESIINFVLHGNQRKNPNCVTFRLSKYMYNVNEVAFRILRTQGSTLAAIGKVEVWGKPSKRVDKEMVKIVKDIWDKIISFPGKKLEPVSQPPKTTFFRYCRERELKVEVDIPEEFLDPITCEILIIPMTLPSGKVVDASTVERFNKIEENFGRPPSDPFTGRIYTETSHPVVATALKGRLDKFLLNHSHIPSLKSVPRTVGRGQPAQPSCSFVNHHQSQNISPPQKNVKNIHDFLEHCLNGLPSFLERPTMEITKNECLKCNSQSLLFKLTCNDLICRNCLVSFKSEKISSCSKCNKQIDYKNVERFHAV